MIERLVTTPGLTDECLQRDAERVVFLAPTDEPLIERQEPAGFDGEDAAGAVAEVRRLGVLDWLERATVEQPVGGHLVETVHHAMRDRPR